MCSAVVFFFFNDPSTPEIYTLSLHDALPISLLPQDDRAEQAVRDGAVGRVLHPRHTGAAVPHDSRPAPELPPGTRAVHAQLPGGLHEALARAGRLRARRRGLLRPSPTRGTPTRRRLARRRRSHLRLLERRHRRSLAQGPNGTRRPPESG